jgi:hypothetical protein
MGAGRVFEARPDSENVDEASVTVPEKATLEPEAVAASDLEALSDTILDSVTVPEPMVFEKSVVVYLAADSGTEAVPEMTEESEMVELETCWENWETGTEDWVDLEVRDWVTDSETKVEVVAKATDLEVELKSDWVASTEEVSDAEADSEETAEALEGSMVVTTTAVVAVESVTEAVADSVDSVTEIAELFTFGVAKEELETWVDEAESVVRGVEDSVAVADWEVSEDSVWVSIEVGWTEVSIEEGASTEDSVVGTAGSVEAVPEDSEDTEAVVALGVSEETSLDDLELEAERIMQPSSLPSRSQNTGPVVVVGSAEEMVDDSSWEVTATDELEEDWNVTFIEVEIGTLDNTAGGSVVEVVGSVVGSTEDVAEEDSLIEDASGVSPTEENSASVLEGSTEDDSGVGSAEVPVM